MRRTILLILAVLILINGCIEKGEIELQIGKEIDVDYFLGIDGEICYLFDSEGWKIMEGIESECKLEIPESAKYTVVDIISPKRDKEKIK